MPTNSAPAAPAHSRIEALPKGKRMKANNVVEEFYTLAQLAHLLGNRAPDTLRRMEQNKQLPPANFRGDEVKLSDGGLREGPRLYSRTLALSLVPLFAQIKVGKKMPDHVAQAIKDAFTAEKLRLIP